MLGRQPRISRGLLSPISGNTITGRNRLTWRCEVSGRGQAIQRSLTIAGIAELAPLLVEVAESIGFHPIREGLITQKVSDIDTVAADEYIGNT